jgi:flagellar protein FliS
MANPYAAYLESKVLTASPLQLVHLAYQGAIDAITEARGHLAAGRIMARGRAITRAQQIITELLSSLDHEKGGELSSRLAGLYKYMRRRLSEAHIKQADEPMAEVQGLLETIDEGWKGLLLADTPAAAAASAGASSPWMSAADAHVHSSAAYTL